ncbi:MAG: hypothetical protein L0H19_02570 [Salinisphaera sp.]|nr:hypothetical protein [Salinisphaera sp.]
MSLKQSVSLRLGQSLSMTPALQQAIRMLQLSTLDLSLEISEALESNLMLETEEGDSGAADTDGQDIELRAPTQDNIPENLPVDANWDDVYQSGPARAPAPRPDEEALWG